MYEIPQGMAWPKLEASINNVTDLLKLRLQCREEKKTGMAAFGFGRAVFIDENGNYVDGKVPQIETDLRELLARLDQTNV